ncbi:MAG: rubredoxin, partial [Maribacter sp.]
FENFDPNSQNYISYAQDIDKIELPGLLMELSKNYFEQLGKVKPPEEVVKKKYSIEPQLIHQCQSCFTVYDQLYGDTKAGITAGTTFNELPKDYVCPVCNTPKSNFKKTSLSIAG